MKTKHFLLIITIFLINTANAQTDNYLGKLYLQTGSYKEAIIEFEKVLPEMEKEKSYLYSETLLYTGLSFFKMKNFIKAEKYYLKCIKFNEEAGTLDDKFYIISLNNLGYIYKLQGKYNKAEELYLKSKNITEKTKGKNNPEYIQCCRNLAFLYKITKKIDKAEFYFVELKNIQETMYGKKSKEYAFSCVNLGEFYYETKKDNKAINIFEETKDIIDTNSFAYSTICNDLAVIYKEKKDYNKAEPMYIKAKEVRAKVFGRKHLNYAHSCKQLADFYNEIKDYKKAIPYLIEENNIKKEKLGKFHADYAESCIRLAETYIYSKKYDKVETLLITAKNISENIYGKESEGYVRCCIDLGAFYTEKEKEKTSYLGYKHGPQLIIKVSYGKNSRNYFEEAETILLEAKILSQKIYGKVHQGYIVSLNNLSNLYLVNKKYKKAESIYIELKEIRKKIYGNQHPDYALSCYNLGALYIDMYKYKEAKPLLLTAKKIRETKFGKNKLYVKTCNKLAEVYENTFEYKKANELYLEVKKLQEETLKDNNQIYINTCVKLADTYTMLNDYIKAEPLYIEAKNKQKETSNIDKTDYLETCKKLAEMYSIMGAYSKAEPLLTELIEKKEKESSDYVDACIELAYTHNRLGNYNLVEKFYSKAKNIFKDSTHKKDLNYATICNNLSVLYQNTGNYKKAEQLLLEAKKIRAKLLGKQSPAYATTIGNLAGIYEKGKINKAFQLYNEALKIYEITIGKDNYKYASLLNNLALLNQKDGNYNKAIVLLKESKNIAEKKYGQLHRSYVTSSTNLAYLYDKTENYSKAESLYIEADSLNRIFRGKHHPSYFLIPHNLASFYDQAGNYDKAELLYIETNDILTFLIHESTKYMTEKEREKYLKEKINNFMKIYNSFFLIRRKENKKNVGIVYNNALNIKGQLLKSSVAMRKTILQSGNTEFINTYNKMNELGQILAKQYSLPISKRREDINELKEKVNILEKKLVRKSQNFTKVSNFAKVNWQTIQKSLKPNETSIEFIHFNYHNGKEWTDSTLYYALILRKGYKYPKAVYLFEEKQLQHFLKREFSEKDEYIETDREQVTRLYSHTSEQSDSLYNMVFKPIEKHMQNNKTLYISPSGLLNNIAFDALTTDSISILSDKYNIFYTSSTSQIINKTVLNNKNIKDAALFGGIEYDITTEQMLANTKTKNPDLQIFQNLVSIRGLDTLTRSISWNYLEGTLKEIEAINEELKKKKIKVKLYTEEQGSEEQFKALEKNAPSILHISTHGFYFGDDKQSEDYKTMIDDKVKFAHSENPLMRSGFILAGGNNTFQGKEIPKGVEDGVLTAAEISRLNFFNTKLVVLSACQTGLGDVKGSEGVYGLQRAFKMAGVDYLLFSLWQVPDYQTQELMTNFYKNWFSNMKIRDAFKKAQNQLKIKYAKNKDAAFAWAAFILIK